MKGFCYYCLSEGELVERADGKWFHPTHSCSWGTSFESKVHWKEGFCYYCGFKENDIPQPYYDNFVKREDGTTWHTKCIS